MAVLTTGHTFVDGQQVTSTRLNNSVNAATFASAAVDGTTTQLSSGAIIVKDLGISTGKIAASAVTTAKLATDSVSTAKIIDSNVTKAKIEDFTNLTVLGNVSGSAATPAEVTIIDDDTMGTASATTLATSESVKAYVDTQIGANNDLSEVLANGNTTGANDIIVTAGQAITTDTVSETTAAAGVTVDSLLIKDGGITAAGTSTFAGQTISDLGTVTTANIDGGSIDGTTVGASSASTGAFTTLTASDDVNFDSGTLFVDASADSVGIGTTSPDGKIDAVIGTDSPIYFRRENNANQNVQISIGSGGSSLTNGGSIAKSFTIGNATNSNLILETNATERMRIDSSGNCGIGTTSPGEVLHLSTVGDSADCRIRLDADATYDTEIKFYNAGAVAYTIGHDDSTNKFVVGTVNVDTPLVTVDSSGNTAFTGDIEGDVITAGRSFKVDNGGYDAPASGEGWFYAESTNGAQLHGYGSTNDWRLLNKNGTQVLRNPTGTTNVICDGRVGIGETSPDSRLHVKDAVTHAASKEVALIQNTTTGQPVALAFQAVADNGGSGNEGAIYFDAGADGTVSNNQLQFTADHQSDNTPDMVITGAGNVGIGTTSPSSRLHVEGVSASSVPTIATYTAGHSAAISSFSAFAGLQLLAYQREGNPYTKSSLVIANSDGTAPSELQFWTKTSGQTTPNERMRIDSSGNVGIGTASPYGKLEVTGGRTYLRGTTENVTLGIGRGGQTSNYFLGTTASASPDLLFSNNTGTTTMVIEHGGNVGIGTTSPANTNGGLDASGAVLARGGVVSNQTSAGGLDFSGGEHLRIRSWGATSGTGYISFRTGGGGGSVDAEAMRIDSSGNVGIGTTSPSHKLEAKSASATTSVRINASDSENRSVFIESPNLNQVAKIGTSGTGNSLSIEVNSTERMRIDSSGNVGIGDSSPSYKLDVNGTLRTTDDIYNNISGTQSALPGYYKDTYGAQIESTGTGSTLHIARSTGNCMNIGADSNATVVYFRDTSAGATVATEVGSISITSTSTSYNESSDYRLKENEVPLADGIDRLKQLNPLRFNFIVDPDNVVDGFLAHEVQDVVPEAIRGEKDGMKDEEYEVSSAVYDDDGELISERVMGTRSVPDYQGIDKSKLVPLLTAALQEAVAKIEALEARVQTLEG